MTFAERQRGINRRLMLGQSSGFALLGLAGLEAGCARAQDCDVAAYEAASDSPLKAQASARGLLFGTAADRDSLGADPAYAQSVVTECAMVTPENSMKWESLRPAPNEFDFENADWLVDFAEENGLAVHGHTLVWNKQNPAWLDTHVDKANAEKLLTDHIAGVAGHYAGRLRSWDVVNEAVNPQEGRSDGLGLSPWLEHLGPGYIDLAFHAAAEADPNAMRVYNDFGLEYEGDYFEDRRRHLLDLLTGIVARNVPIDALGVQSHLSASMAPDFARFDRFLSDVADLGLDIMVTELDVYDEEVEGEQEERDCLVAATYKAYLDVVLAWPRLRSLGVWGLSDRYSWLTWYAPRDDGQPVRPLPLDEDMNRKPAWNAISRAIAG